MAGRVPGLRRPAGPPLSARGDERYTPLGRSLAGSRLDELPQLWNILRGQMRMIGPRPELEDFVRHVPEEYERILSVPPGLTGPAQRVCIVGPALSALDQGFEVYIITDACGDVSDEAHERAMDRMVQAGARPMTSLQYLLELQRDWARAGTYELTTGIAKRLGGGYGLGLYSLPTPCGPIWGHDGGVPGYVTVAYFWARMSKVALTVR